MTDVLIVGGGLAGWRAAEAAAAAGASVTLVANGAGNSPHIHALNCPVRADDSVDRMAADTMSSGHGTNDPSLVRVLCEGAAKLKDEFAFDRGDDGEYVAIQPLGSTVPRCVSIDHAIGAIALARIRARLAGKVRTAEGTVGKIEKTADGFSIEWVSADGAVERAAARSVVLATGGWCGKYAFSTNPEYLRGDGIALGESLGADTVDMDAVQCEPTVRVDGPRRGVPVITTLLYRGATLRNRKGEEFLGDPRLNKDELSKAIFAEMEKSGDDSVLYDLTAVSESDLIACKMNPAERTIRIAPAPHTSLGGLRIDALCRVLGKDGRPIPGLFAAGEVTGGLHGRNRLGGNAGTEVMVFGRIAGENAAASGTDSSPCHAFSKKP